MDATDEAGDIDVQDVTVLQHPRVGDAVADDFVGAGAHALRIVVVVQRAGICVARDGQLVHVPVDRIGV